MNSSKKFRLFLLHAWEPLLASSLATFSVASLLFFRLGSLVPGLSLPELNSQQQAQTWRLILDNPINAPYKLGQLALSILGQQSAFMLRSLSALAGLVFVALVYYLLSRWHTRRIALLGTVLFTMSSWFLHYARFAAPDILFVSIILTLVYGTWIRSTNRSLLVLLSGTILTVYLLYIPGMIWFVLFGGIWQRKALFRHYKNWPTVGFLLMLVGAALILPLGYALVIHTDLISPLLGLPQTFPEPMGYIKNLLGVPYQLFIRGPDDPVVWLGRTPLLDVFTMAMTVLGTYAYFFRRKLDRVKMLAGGIVLSSLLIAAGGPVRMIILLPFIYILAAAGITLMLQQWFTVFPRNPLARLVGTTLISVAIIMAGFYHVNHYFIAWPNTPETRQAFSIKR